MAERLRPMVYRETDVFLVCFSLRDIFTLDNVLSQWLPELAPYAGSGTPWFLIGCKKDLQTNQNQSQILKQLLTSSEWGKQRTGILKPQGYLECSTVTGEGVHEILLAASEVAYRHGRTRRQDGNGGCIVV